MARDGTGQYNLPTGAVVNATAIDPNDENATRSDIATALTGSLARDGQGAMTGPLNMDGRALLNGGAGTFTSMNGGPLAGFRNLIINGNPFVNQRSYASAAATTAANQYTLDRWRVVVSGQALTFTDSLGVQTVTAPAGGMEQVIEGASVLGGVHTLSWVGTATATVDSAAVANRGQVTLAGGANVTVRLSGGTASLIQLEPGTQATPFERRPIGVEFLLCQRYFDTGVAIVGYHASGVGTVHSFPVPFVRKRVTPTVAQSPTATFNVASFTVDSISQSSLNLELQATAAGNCGATSSWTASAEL